MKQSQILTEIARVGSCCGDEHIAALSSAEFAEWQQLKSSERRRTFLAGRWLAKKVIPSRCAGILPQEIRITSKDENGRGSAPRVKVNGNLWEGALSITHTYEWVAVAVGLDTDNLGIDLVHIVPRPLSFVRAWFTACEAESLELESPQQLAAAWGAKEAAYKALNRGESFRPREMTVSRTFHGNLLEVSWNSCRCDVDITPFEDHILALASVSEPSAKAGISRQVATHVC